MLTLLSGYAASPAVTGAIDCRPVAPGCLLERDGGIDRGRMVDRSSILEAVLHALRQPAFVCDSEARFLLGNEAAKTLFEAGDGVALRSQRFCITDRTAQQKLRRVLGTVANGRGDCGAPPVAAAALLIPRPSALPAYQTVLRCLSLPGEPSDWPSGNTWLICVSDAARIVAANAQAFAALYGLTPAEARLAHNLALGACLPKIAAAGKVRISTLRSQISSLLRKTGAQRQADIVRLMASMPALY